MNQILDKYRTALVFTKEEDALIDKAIDLDIISATDIMEDFMQYRDEQLDNFEGWEPSDVIYFNEHYQSGLTHIQNFTNLVQYLRDNTDDFEIGRII